MQMMTTQEFYRSLEEVLEADDGTITGIESLADLDGWDSLAILGFLAMADSKLGLTIPAQAIAGCASVQDLKKLLGNQIRD